MYALEMESSWPGAVFTTGGQSVIADLDGGRVWDRALDGEGIWDRVRRPSRRRFDWPVGSFLCEMIDVPDCEGVQERGDPQSLGRPRLPPRRDVLDDVVRDGRLMPLLARARRRSTRGGWRERYRSSEPHVLGPQGKNVSREAGNEQQQPDRFQDGRRANNAEVERVVHD